MVRGEQPFWISRYSKNSAISNSKAIFRFCVSPIAWCRKSDSLRHDLMLIPLHFRVKCLPIFDPQASSQSNTLPFTHRRRRHGPGAERRDHNSAHSLALPAAPAPRSLNGLPRQPGAETSIKPALKRSGHVKDVYLCLFQGSQNHFLERASGISSLRPLDSG